MAELVLISAFSRENRVIGNKGRIPWFGDWQIRNPDMIRFRDLTIGHPVIMGRSTFDSIRKPLSKRKNIILSRRDFCADGIYVCHSVEESLREADDDKYRQPTFVIGGQQIYELFIDRDETRKLEITEVNGNYDGDAFFPKIDRNKWDETYRSPFDGYSFVRYERR